MSSAQDLHGVFEIIGCVCVSSKNVVVDRNRGGDWMEINN